MERVKDKEKIKNSHFETRKVAGSQEEDGVKITNLSFIKK